MKSSMGQLESVKKGPGGIVMSASGSGLAPYMALMGQANYDKLSGPQKPAAQSPYQRDPMSYYNSQAAQQRPPRPAPQAPGGQGGQGGNASILSGQAVDSGNVLGRLGQESQYTPTMGTQTGIQGGKDLSKSLSANSRAQIGRGVEAANAQQSSANHVMKSELTQAAMANQARIYGDMAQRSNDQLSLATKLQEAMIRNRMAFAQTLLGS
jgi:hypothetical protein